MSTTPWVVVVLSLVPLAPASAMQDDLDLWLADNVVPIRSQSLLDTNFSDLEPLARVIRDRRIVMLGEPSHGAGTVFEMKTRLARFLIERMGFDVMIWESGLFDMDAVGAALRSGADPTEAFRRGVFTVWGDTRELRPFFEYVQSLASSPRPVEMAGFDIQFSGRDADERFAEELLEFVEGAMGEALQETGRVLATELTRLFGRFTALRRVVGERGNRLFREGVPPREIGPLLRQFEDQVRDSLAPVQEEFDRFQVIGDSLRALITGSRAGFETTYTPRRVDFFLRTLENYSLNGRRHFEDNTLSLPSDGPERQAIANAQWNRRDAQNASNLIWLVNDYFAGRKIIVWAHTGHIFDAHYSADWSTLSHAPQPGGMTPTGSLVQEELRDEAYRVGFVAHHGVDGWITSLQKKTIDPAPDGTLESHMHDLEIPFGFVDLRGKPGGSPLLPSVRFGLRIRGYTVDELEDWSRVVDGLVYVDSIAPATAWTN